jgi:hypothetical protein
MLGLVVALLIWVFVRTALTNIGPAMWDAHWSRGFHHS